MPTNRFSPSRHRVFRSLRFNGRSPTPGSLLGTMASADFPGHFLLGISPDKSVLLPGTTAAFTSTTEPATSLRGAPSSHRVGLDMRFLFVGPPVSSSLPPAGWLPFQRWLQVVVLSHFHVTVLPQGTFTPFTTRPCWAYTTQFWLSSLRSSARTGPLALLKDRNPA